MLGDLTCDFKLSLFQLLFFSTLHLLLSLHTCTGTVARTENHLKFVNFLQIIQTTEYQNQTQSLLKQCNCNFLLLCFWQVAHPEGGKKWRFPFGKELTTCWRLFIWRGGLACATVNKLKCWEVQWVSGAPSKAVPTWHTCFWCAGQVCILNRYDTYQVSCTQTPLTTEESTRKLYVICPDACSVVTHCSVFVHIIHKMGVNTKLRQE